ncbi:S26 family signal peptidase [Halococcus sp. AFM35]|uniref:S26 family signal peptidase n=1 Tax=Halococcus sp. AFM35 TaxID=3421653 RepID=UPI003EB9D957
MDSGDGDGGWPGRWDGRETDSGTDETTNDSEWNSDGLTGDEREDRANDDGSERGESGPLARARWFMNTDEEWVVFVREVLSSLAVVAVVGLVLFAVSGLWPPMVAIESSSMAPNMERGDLVFLMEEHRFAGGAAYNGTGVVPYQAGAAAGYSEFNKYGDVIVYQPDGDEGETPIIHRARFWVNASENWYDEANEEYLGGADNCEELANCPAPHGGFITKGDNNGLYDQVDTGDGAISSPVKPEWVTGTAEFKIPWLGRIRLLFGMTDPTVAVSTTGPSWNLADIGMGIGSPGPSVAG